MNNTRIAEMMTTRNDQIEDLRHDLAERDARIAKLEDENTRLKRAIELLATIGDIEPCGSEYLAYVGGQAIDSQFATAVDAALAALDATENK